MTGNIETGRNNKWKEWYPTVRPDLTIPLDQSPYGQPNAETLGLFTDLPRGSKIGDVGGGEGRYALPLARMGHTVIVTDVDMPHLTRAREKKSLDNVVGDIIPLQTDATENFPIKESSLDGILNAGFGYLIPPDELVVLFRKMTESVRPGGLIVFEFATNRDRRVSKGEKRSLIGSEEYNYSKREGSQVLDDLFNQHSLTERTITEKTIHFEEPYYMHNDLLIVAGRKPNYV